ncbi:MAG: flavodoxin domain-containing protein, partial [Planctomycetes bacterium]|nr:flavodoxin domain-containing protein [Planctomycetota bacterium]
MRFSPNMLVVWIACSAATAGSLSAAESPPGQNGDAGHARVRILIAYHSLRGNTEQMAKAVAEGVARVDGAVAAVKRVEECSKEELQAADGIILGCPTY